MMELIAFSSKGGKEIATSLNFNVTHGGTAWFLSVSEKYYIYFADNSLLF